jgi:hypothetical protein
VNQKDLIKYALIALGAYLVYQYIQSKGGFAAVLGTATGTGTPAPAPVNTSSAAIPLNPNAGPASAPPGASFKARIAAATGGVTQLTMDQWCFYFAKIVGHACPDPTPLFPGVDRAQTMDIDTFWTGVEPWLATTYPGLGMFAPAYNAAVWLN